MCENTDVFGLGTGFSSEPCFGFVYHSFFFLLFCKITLGFPCFDSILMVYSHFIITSLLLRLTAYYVQQWGLCEARTGVPKVVDDDDKVEGNGGNMCLNKK